MSKGIEGAGKFWLTVSKLVTTTSAWLNSMNRIWNNSLTIANMASTSIDFIMELKHASLNEAKNNHQPN